MNRRRLLKGALAAAVGAQLPISAYPAILSPSMKADADVDVVTGDGNTVTLKRAALQELGDSLRGNLILPGHSAYEEARRLRNPSLDKYPALIVQPRGVTDVRNAVDFARSSGVLLAVKCGGHSHSGKSSCDQPDELSIDAGLYSLRGGVAEGLMFGICYSGPKNGADRILETVRSAGTPINDTVRAVDYVALQKSGDDTDARGAGSYTKSGFSRALTPAFIDAILDGFEARPDRSTIFAFQQGGGAIGRVPADDTAFPHRDITLTPLLVIDWDIERDPSADIAWLRQYWASVQPHISGFYTNDLIDETQEQVDANYLGNYPRLVVLKNKFDPTNLFRLNANIIPDERSAGRG